MSVAHGLQRGVEGARLVRSGKEKSKGNLIANYSYLKIVTRIRATQQVQTIQGATGRSCTLEGSYQEIPGRVEIKSLGGWCNPGKGHQGGGGSLSLKPFKTLEDKSLPPLTTVPSS